MSYPLNHIHVANIRDQLRAGPASPLTYAAVVGIFVKGSIGPISGRDGDHLQFSVDIGGGKQYRVDVNTQSLNGSDIELYVANQNSPAAGPNPGQPVGTPDYGVFTDAQLSYSKMGLTDNDFSTTPYYQFESLLTASLNTATFVCVYGMTFDDPGPDGLGIHETHYNPEETNEDGAVLVYYNDPAGKPVCTWFFSKFNGDTLDP